MDFKTLISLYLCIVYVHGQPINQISVIQRRIVKGCMLLKVIKTAKGLPSTLGIGHCCDDTKTTSFLTTKSVSTSTQTTKMTFKTVGGNFILAEKNSKVVFEPFQNGSTPALRHYFIMKNHGSTILSPASKPGYFLDVSMTNTIILINGTSTATSYIEVKTRPQSRCDKVTKIPNYCSKWISSGSC